MDNNSQSIPFEKAIIAMKLGKSIARESWYDDDNENFIYTGIISVFIKDGEVVSLNEGEWSEYKRRWSASSEDLLADDWIVLGE